MKNSGSQEGGATGTRSAMFLGNLLIVADDDKSAVARAPEMFGYKFLLASLLGIA
jgi:hypothetical protein